MGSNKGGVFATAQETAYPEQLCIALARSVASFLDLGDLPRLSLDARKRYNPSKKYVASHRIAAGLQPRGSRAPRLLPEFREVLDFACDLPPSDARTQVGHKWREQLFQDTSIPEGSRTISASWKGESGHSSGMRPITPIRGRIAEVSALGDRDIYIGRGTSRKGWGRTSAVEVGQPFSDFGLQGRQRSGGAL